MAWSYSGNPQNSKLDECRFLLGDTDAKKPILQDEEIMYIISTTGNDENRLKYELFKQAATLFARDIKRSLGPQSEDPTQRLDYFKSQMKLYQTKMYSSGLSLPKYSHPKIFNVGMQNNPPWRK